MLERPRGARRQVSRGDGLVDRAVEHEADPFGFPFDAVGVEAGRQRGGRVSLALNSCWRPRPWCVQRAVDDVRFRAQDLRRVDLAAGWPRFGSFIGFVAECPELCHEPLSGWDLDAGFHQSVLELEGLERLQSR